MRKRGNINRETFMWVLIAITLIYNYIPMQNIFVYNVRTCKCEKVRKGDGEPGNEAKRWWHIVYWNKAERLKGLDTRFNYYTPFYIH